MTIARWQNNLSKFVRLDGADKWLLLRATGWLAIARIMLAVLSFRRAAERLSGEHESAGAEPDPELLQRISHAMAIAANHVPWRSDCFPQTIAARLLLRRYGYASTIHIGVERVGDDTLNGHAWLTCGDTVVTGGTDLHRYTELHRQNL
jgi:Transglutaminase-like superfamily